MSGAMTHDERKGCLAHNECKGCLGAAGKPGSKNPKTGMCIEPCEALQQELGRARRSLC